jgi:hypothetical protein
MDTTTVAQPTTREQRGLELYRERRGEFVRISKDVTEVPGSKRGVYYRTNLGVGSCSCPDHRRRGGTCKHLAASELYRSFLRRAAATIADALDAGEEG